MGLEILEGRALSTEFAGDSSGSIVVNEKFVEWLGLDEPIGKRPDLGDQNAQGPLIVGVVKDFHFLSLKKDIEPMVIALRPGRDYRNAVIKIKSENIQN